MSSSLHPKIQAGLARIQAEVRAAQESSPLPDWTNDLRAAPNEVLRSSIFGIVRRGRRAYVREMLIPSPEGYKISYTGERLDQADLDIWLQFLHMARGKKQSDEIRFSIRCFLKQIGRNVGKSDYNWIERRITTMIASATRIEDKNGRVLISGGLVSCFGFDPMTSEAIVKLNEHVRKLFGNYTLIRWSDRLSLGSDQLAKWLHAYYSTHANPYPLKVETILRLCGSEAQTLRYFRAKLRGALDTLKRYGFLLEWKIDAQDLVHVNRCPSPTQSRHLARRVSP